MYDTLSIKPQQVGFVVYVSKLIIDMKHDCYPEWYSYDLLKFRTICFVLNGGSILQHKKDNSGERNLKNIFYGHK